MTFSPLSRELRHTDSIPTSFVIASQGKTKDLTLALVVEGEGRVRVLRFVASSFPSATAN
jgi:hypothetical protein